MPFESLAQEGYMHEHPEILGKKGLAEWDAATKGKHLPHHVGEKMSKHKKHGYKSTHIEHHDDGSHTVTHHHHEDPKKDYSYAKPDLDGVHDGLEQHLGEPNEGEAPPPAAEAGAVPGAGM